MLQCLNVINHQLPVIALFACFPSPHYFFLLPIHSPDLLSSRPPHTFPCTSLQLSNLSCKLSSPLACSIFNPFQLLALYFKFITHLFVIPIIISICSFRSTFSLFSIEIVSLSRSSFSNARAPDRPCSLPPYQGPASKTRVVFAALGLPLSD